MKVVRSAGELAAAERAVAIGMFDGVHLGHRRVLEALLETGLTPTVITFDPAPGNPGWHVSRAEALRVTRGE